MGNSFNAVNPSEEIGIPPILPYVALKSVLPPSVCVRYIKVSLQRRLLKLRVYNLSSGRRWI